MCFPKHPLHTRTSHCLLPKTVALERWPVPLFSTKHTTQLILFVPSLTRSCSDRLSLNEDEEAADGDGGADAEAAGEGADAEREPADEGGEGSRSVAGRRAALRLLRQV